MSEKQHPGISMHKIPVGGGFMGLLFAVGSALIFLLGLPALWYFVAFSGALGVVVAVIIQGASRRRSNRGQSLSILSATEAAPPKTPSNESRINWLRWIPRLNPA